MRSTRISCAARLRCYTLPRVGFDIAAPSSRNRLRRGERFSMDDEARATRPRPRPDRAPRQRPRWGRRSPYGTRVTTARRAGRRRRGRPMRRSISAPTIAGCWWRAPTRDSFRVVDAFSRIIRLGEGVVGSGRLERGGDRRAPSRRSRVCRDKMRNRGVTRARLIATEACRAAGNGAEFLRPRRASEVGHRARDRRPRDRGAARRHRLHAADRSAGRRRDPVRHRRRLLRAGAARAARAPAERGPPHAADRGLGVAAGRRRDAGRAPRRRARSTREIFEAMIAEVAVLRRPLRRRAWRRRDRAHAPARHLRHGDDHRRRASRAAALRAPPGRRLLDERRRRSRAWSSGCSP